MRPAPVLKITMVAVLAAAALTVPAKAAAPPPQPSALAASSAERLVAEQPGLIHRAALDQLVRKPVVAGAHGLHYVPYERTYAGLPVRGGDFVVVTDADGRVLSTSVNQKQALSVETRPQVSAEAAGESARREAGAMTEVSPPALTVLARGSGLLAYETLITGVRGDRPSRLHVYVDARTGKVIDSWDEVRDGTGNSFYHGQISFATTRSSTLYGMSDPLRAGVRCGGMDGRTYTDSDDVWGDGSGTDLVTACVDAMHAAQGGYDMVTQWLGRSGIDGYGRSFPMRVGYQEANAYYDTFKTVFGRNSSLTRQATSTDVVMHELGHAIFDFTPGGAPGTWEKGGLNESTGDIFGTVTEWFLNEQQLDPPDYLVGEQVDLVGAGPIRNMYDPSLLGDPKCFSDAVRYMEVHAAAGVQNHWFYLLAEGSAPGGAGRPGSPTCNGSAVRGIGVRDAAMIYMETLNRKVSDWSHEEARRASMEAAMQLFGCQALLATRAAWDAVTVPRHPAEPTCG